MAVEPAEVTEPLTPLTIEELLEEQKEDEFCQEARARLADNPNCQYFEDHHGLICRRAQKDNAEQIILPKTLRRQALLLAHYLRLAGHPGGSLMYQTLRRTFYWPSMALDAYHTVRQCSSCTRERITLREHATYLSLFPAQAPLEYVAIDILGPLPKTTDGHRYLLCITDRYSKMVRTIPLKNITAATVAKAFCEHWVFHCGPPAHLLSDNGGQFTAKFFQDVCAILGIRKLFTTAYHPQTNGQVEGFNRTILAGLRHYCSEHGRHRDRFSHAITFAYKNTVQRATGLTPLDLVLTRPPKLLNLENVETINHGALGPRQEKTKFSQRLKVLMKTADARLEKCQARYRRDFDKRVRQFNTGLKPGDLVFVKRETATESEERNRAA